ncbi:threonine-phosphate decarboxylase CobD [Marinicrinis lubricantis]|uniref:threonine-phosphate decarboxylase n=1 Tax=Marinicrinis lubricantis TaxID=2086470 RepID=A0ABW1IQU9_9BACL
MLEKYGHGGDLTTAEELYGRPTQKWLDFSANMNPLGPPESVQSVLERFGEHIGRYPDPRVRGLRQKIAEKYRIPVESIWVGNGAAECIDGIVKYLRPASAAVTSPAFTEYEDALHKVDAKVTHIPLRAEQDYRLIAEDLPPAGNMDLYMIGHPNNPTGRTVEARLIKNLLEQGETVVLDEAFIDFQPEEEELTFIRIAAQHPRCFVIRSMTKFYTIPGIRLGFAVSHPDHIAALMKQQIPWSVNGLAQMIGEEVLGDDGYAERTLLWLAEEREWFRRQLQETGLICYPSETNFLLLELPARSGWTAPLAQRWLARRGILIRDASLFYGLHERCLRTAIRLREENAVLVSALRDMLASEPEGGGEE